MGKDLSVPEAIAARLRPLAQKGGRLDLQGLAEATGLPYPTLQKVMAGKVMPQAETLAVLARHFGRSIEWVLTGEETNPAYGQPAGEIVRIPIVEVEAAAGFGRQAPPDPTIVDGIVMPVWLARSMGSVEHLKIVVVRGESQEPDLSDGDLVMYDGSQLYRAPGMYVVVLDGDLVVKRLQRTPEGVTILSRHPEYDPIDVPAAEVDERLRVLGKVVWSGKQW